MQLAKWNEKDLRYMEQDGYKICKCKDEQEAIEIKDLLKQNNRCAQAGYILNSKNEKVYFAITRERKTSK